MQLRPDHLEPPAFAAVCQAFHLASHLPAAHAMHLNIGLLDEEGRLVAEGSLDGYRQVACFTQALSALGYEGRLVDGDGRAHGCDVLFAAPPTLAASRYQVGRRFWQVGRGTHAFRPAMGR